MPDLQNAMAVNWQIRKIVADRLIGFAISRVSEIYFRIGWAIGWGSRPNFGKSRKRVITVFAQFKVDRISPSFA